LYKIIGVILLLISGLYGARASEAEPLSQEGLLANAPRYPLTQIVNAEKQTLHLRFLILDWDNYCAFEGQEKLTNALVPFKDFSKLNLNGLERTLAERALADLFWRGDCIEQDRKFALSVYQGAAFRYGYSIFDKHYRSDAHGWTLSEGFDQNPPASDIKVALLKPRQNGTKFKEININEYYGADTMYTLTFFYLPGKILPVTAEMNILNEMISSGPDGAVKAALSLRKGIFDLPDEDQLALRWMIYASRILEHPYAKRALPFWLRDRNFRRKREKTGDADPRDSELRYSNALLLEAVKDGDAKFLPLVYCLIKEKTALAASAETYQTLYSLLMLMSEKDIAPPQDEIKTIKNKLLTLEKGTLDFLENWKIETLSADLLPTYDVDLSSCAERFELSDAWNNVGYNLKLENGHTWGD